MFLGMIAPLIGKYAISKKTIRSTIQDAALTKASTRFQALLATIPYKKDGNKVKYKSLRDLIDVIGEFFFQKTVMDDFSSDPPTTFIIDKLVSKDVVFALGNALNQGALVYMVDDPNKPLLDTLVGKRFRLNHILAPHYKLPLITSKSRNLSNILNPNLKTLPLLEEEEKS